eukprot:1887261-Ditylum_brightwellii.AAC.1
MPPCGWLHGWGANHFYQRLLLMKDRQKEEVSGHRDLIHLSMRNVSEAAPKCLQSGRKVGRKIEVIQ